ncbi:MAG TPA: hypothetical protein VND93_11650 [Myxococcales bacterium]|jgi:hypothetical protein|nr:hypothetical protein [Myxococcales bacterium]
MAKEPIGGFLAIEVEIRKEKASALKRVGGKLEALLDDLQELESKLPRAPSRERPRFVERHRMLRAEAEKYRWYLVVQREAIGLTNHDDVLTQYPIPAPLR